jgi:hypothetical protein
MGGRKYLLCETFVVRIRSLVMFYVKSTASEGLQKSQLRGESASFLPKIRIKRTVRYKKKGLLGAV